MSLSFPKPSAVTDLLSRLLGEAPILNEDKQTPPFTDMRTPYASACRTDSGEAVIAVVADLSAALYLGGKLMMMPVGGLEDQAKAGLLDEGTLDAFSEVINNILICLNEIEGNPHVCSSPALPMSTLIKSADGAWIPAASHRMDLVGDFVGGPGRIVIVAR